MSTVYKLQKLQHLDQEIQENKTKLGKILRAKQEPQPLVQRREIVASLQQTIHALKGQLKDEELELGTVSNKLSQSQQKLYSGEVKNPKALQDLELESESLTRRRSALEDQMLETMTELETSEASLNLESDALKAEQAAWEQLLAQLEQDQSQVATRLNDLLGRRQDQAAGVDEATLRDYDNLLKSKNGLAVAEVINGICQGCRVTMNSAVMRALKTQEFVKCPTCYRILTLTY